MFIKEDKFVKATDDWFPCFENNTVKVHFETVLYNTPQYYGYNSGQSFIWVSGMDDDAMEMRFYFEYCTEAILEEAYKQLKEVFDNIPEVVDHKWFAENGFVRG